MITARISDSYRREPRWMRMKACLLLRVTPVGLENSLAVQLLG